MEVDIKEDLNTITDQLGQLGQELDKINNSRNTLIGQIQNLQGVAMYLRGKLPPEERQEVVEQKEGSTEDFERSTEYPSNEES
jgi:hypothetical protein